MVKKLAENGKRVYACEECGLTYINRTWAEKCEAFCTNHHACSLEITSHATNLQ